MLLAWFTKHFTHEAAPVADCHVPAGQSVQLLDPLSSAYEPGRHREQVEATVAPTTVEKLPSGHLVQVAFERAPVTSDQVPATHGVQ